MVYMEPEGLGMECYVDSWLQSGIPPGFHQPNKEKKVIKETLDKLLKGITPLIKTVHKKCKEVSPTKDANNLQSLIRLLDCFFEEYYPTEAKTPNDEEIEALEPMFSDFSLIYFLNFWLIGPLSAVSKPIFASQ